MDLPNVQVFGAVDSGQVDLPAELASGQVDLPADGAPAEVARPVSIKRNTICYVFEVYYVVYKRLHPRKIGFLFSFHRKLYMNFSLYRLFLNIL